MHNNFPRCYARCYNSNWKRTAEALQISQHHHDTLSIDNDPLATISKNIFFRFLKQTRLLWNVIHISRILIEWPSRLGILLGGSLKKKAARLNNQFDRFIGIFLYRPQICILPLISIALQSCCNICSELANTLCISYFCSL